MSRLTLRTVAPVATRVVPAGRLAAAVGALVAVQAARAHQVQPEPAGAHAAVRAQQVHAPAGAGAQPLLVALVDI